MATDCGIYFKRDDLCKLCHYGFAPYYRMGDGCDKAS